MVDSLPEELRLNQIVEKNPHDFASWESLVALIERQTDFEKVKSVYNEFLARFPQCFAYWKKYAEAAPDWLTSAAVS